jgi:hypothetical protein
MRKAVFCDVMPCGSCKNRRFGGTLLFIANLNPSSLILFTLMMEAIRSSGISVLKRATRRNILGDGILPNHRCEDFKSYVAL